MNKDFKEYYYNFKHSFDLRFNSIIYNKNYPKILIDSLNYISDTGGKRLRPFLVCECASLFDIPIEKSIFAASAIEMVHCYSLIHDDLPAMDDDDMRRGHKTLHNQFSEDIAILTGDALLSDAFYLIAKNYAEANMVKKLVLLLSNFSGGSGMVGGQILDLYPISDSKDDIEYMNKLKTGALIKCAVLFGAVLGQADKNKENILLQFGDLIGKAFQITDDILDVNGNEKIIGKKINKDKSRGKLSLIDHYGIEGARNEALNHINEAQKLLDVFGDKATHLLQLTEYILNRRK